MLDLDYDERRERIDGYRAGLAPCRERGIRVITCPRGVMTAFQPISPDGVHRTIFIGGF